jgi:hypothetical protein
MSIIDSHRNALANKRKDLSKLMHDKANLQSRITQHNKQIAAASDAINKTKNTSTINTKQREIQRCQASIGAESKKLGTLESQIAKKYKEISDYEHKISKEEAAADKKRSEESQRQLRQQERDRQQMQSTLNHHASLHHEMRYEIDKMKKLPDKVVVLFLASNPIDQQSLRLDEEVRGIADMIRKAKHRDAVKLESTWAVQPMDVLQALNEHRPTIVHFSGHGSDEDEIVFQNPDGTAKFVTKEAIVHTMTVFSSEIRLVFFNTCYSRNQAEAVSMLVEATIGMNTTIGDQAARVFSSQFYSAIGFGHSLKMAFDQAKTLLMLEGIDEQDTPELFVREGLNAEDIYLVKPFTGS